MQPYKLCDLICKFRQIELWSCCLFTLQSTVLLTLVLNFQKKGLQLINNRSVENNFLSAFNAKLNLKLSQLQVFTVWCGGLVTCADQQIAADEHHHPHLTAGCFIPDIWRAKCVLHTYTRRDCRQAGRAGNFGDALCRGQALSNRRKIYKKYYYYSMYIIVRLVGGKASAFCF